MKTYVVGFIFDSAIEHVLLIHKNRPDWQRGLLNGPGGKIEEGEDGPTAVSREIEEETGLITRKEEWVSVGFIHGDGYSVEFFGYIYTGAPADAKTMTDEEVGWFSVRTLPSHIIPNLNWLIPITVDKLKNSNLESFTVTYGKEA